MVDDSQKNQEIELLKLEYRECQNGYNSRDKMAEDEFCKVIQVFSVFLTILVAFSVFAKVGWYSNCAVCLLIGVTGLMCLVSLLVVIESNSSCKVALRKRCGKIRERLQALVGFKLSYWDAIEQRARHWEEKKIKGALGVTADKDRTEAEQNIFVTAVRLLIFLWMVIVIAAVLRPELLRPKTQDNNEVRDRILGQR